MLLIGEDDFFAFLAVRQCKPPTLMLGIQTPQAKSLDLLRGSWLWMQERPAGTESDDADFLIPYHLSIVAACFFFAFLPFLHRSYLNVP